MGARSNKLWHQTKGMFDSTKSKLEWNGHSNDILIAIFGSPLNNKMIISNEITIRLSEEIVIPLKK